MSDGIVMRLLFRCPIAFPCEGKVALPKAMTDEVLSVLRPLKLGK